MRARQFIAIAAVVVVAGVHDAAGQDKPTDSPPAADTKPEPSEEPEAPPPQEEVDAGTDEPEEPVAPSPTVERLATSEPEPRYTTQPRPISAVLRSTSPALDG